MSGILIKRCLRMHCNGVQGVLYLREMKATILYIYVLICRDGHALLFLPLFMIQGVVYSKMLLIHRIQNQL